MACTRGGNLARKTPKCPTATWRRCAFDLLPHPGTSTGGGGQKNGCSSGSEVVRKVVSLELLVVLTMLVLFGFRHQA